MRAFSDSDPARTSLCDRCGLKYRPEDIHSAGDGTWDLCTGCLAVLEEAYPLAPSGAAYEDEDYEDYSRRVTHEGQYEDEAQDEPYSGHALDDENDSLALLVRTTGGLRIEALQGFIVATQDGASVTVDVADADLLDAFRHPALYLGPERCAQIGLS